MDKMEYDLKLYIEREDFESARAILGKNRNLIKSFPLDECDSNIFVYHLPVDNYHISISLAREKRKYRLDVFGYNIKEDLSKLEKMGIKFN